MGTTSYEVPFNNTAGVDVLEHLQPPTSAHKMAGPIGFNDQPYLLKVSVYAYHSSNLIESPKVSMLQKRESISLS